jgi:thymidylate synthase (FAD)
MTVNRNETAEVKLFYYTPLTVALYAGLVCTDSEDKIEKYNAQDFIKKIIDSGHTSVIEHINYTFVIDKISRGLLQEQARHRHISLSVQSTRWAFKKYSKNINFYRPNKEIDKLSEQQKSVIAKLDNTMDELYIILNEAVNAEIPNDILKYYIPESINTKYVITLNARELRLLFELRTSKRALKEFQNLCKTIYDSLPEDHKFMYSDFFENK